MIRIENLKAGDKVRRISSPHRGEIFTYDGTSFNCFSLDREPYVRFGLAILGNWEHVEKEYSSDLREVLAKLESLTAQVEKMVVQEKSSKRRQGPSRREVIERAKKDIGNAFQDDTITEKEFHVNHAKGKVTALIRGKLTDIVYNTGRAQVSSDDIFDEHIGKAIALRRALGLKVPEEYLNAPQK